VTRNTSIPGIDKLVPLYKFVKNDRPRMGAVINAINVLSRDDNSACSSQHLPAYLYRPSEHLSALYSNLEAETIRMHAVYTHVKT
jgi:hypothetical protein